LERRISWPHDIACSRWFPQAVFEIAPCRFIFNHIKFCAEKLVLTVHCWAIAFFVVFWSNRFFVCLRHAGKLCHAGGAQTENVEQNSAHAAAHLQVKKGIRFLQT
jgi:hypothetical protein